MSLTLWGRASSVNVQKVLWALDEMGLDYDHEVVGGKYGGYDRPEFAAHSPLPRVPMLIDDGLAVWESHAILRHLARKSGRFGAPETPVDMWMEFGSTTVQPSFLGIFYQQVRMPLADRSASAEARHRAELATALTVLDDHLAEQAFLAGAEFTVADIAMGSMMYRLHDVAPEMLDPVPHVSAWHARLAARPAWGRWIATSYEELRAPGTVRK